MLRKLILFLPLLAASCLVGALYGALHDQISVTVSPEYFTRFKFIQFAIPDGTPLRLGAALVGVYASWWMGLVIGLPILIVAMFGRAADYHRHWWFATGNVVATSALLALSGLALATLFVTPDIAAGIAPAHITDKVGFTRVGTMHEGSYLGGALGLIILVIRLILRIRRSTKATP